MNVELQLHLFCEAQEHWLVHAAGAWWSGWDEGWGGKVDEGGYGVDVMRACFKRCCSQTAGECGSAQVSIRTNLHIL